MQPTTGTRTGTYLFLRFATVVLLAMALCVCAASAAPLVPGVEPAEQIPSLFAAAPLGERPALPAEMPGITMQLSAVKAKDGSLDQTMELALLLNLPQGESFSALNVALQFDPAKIKPITFRCQADASGVFTPDIALGATAVHVPALMNENLTEAAAYADASGNLLFRAAAYAPTDFGLKAEDGRVVTLAVIRFAAVPAVAGTKPLTLDKDKTTPLYNNAAITDFVKFQDDAAAAKSDVHAALSYEYAAGGSKTRLYHVPAYDPANTKTWGKIPVPGLVPETKIDAPNTAGMRVLSMTAGTPNNSYSYLSNHLSKDEVAFSVAVGETFNGKLDPNEFCAVSFRDWSGEELGTLIVPMYQDVRGQVSEHVKANWIHPDLRERADYRDMSRANTYRGKYPASGPSGADTVTNGAQYPLTNKLDYAFISAPVVWEGGGGSYQFNRQIENAFPYAYGWMIAAPNHETTQPLWSTFGVGELAAYSPATPQRPYPQFTTTPGKSDYFRFADFKDLRVRQLKAYAGYLPGELLKGTMLYRVVDMPQYTRYTYTASPDGATYSLKFKYERVYDAGGGKLYGTSRVRQPSIQFGMKPDIIPVGQTNDKSSFTYIEIVKDNGEVIEVDLTPTSKINAVNYTLMDAYSANFMTGSKRSASGNELNFPENFDYLHYSYGDHLGSQGFVTTATIRCMLDEASKASKGLENQLNTHWQMSTVQDLNLRKAGGASYTDETEAKTMFQSMVDAALLRGGEFVNASGYADLTWHQMQYYFLHQQLKTVAELNAGSETASLERYNWCHQYDGCKSLTSITTLPQLLAAAKSGSLPGLTLDACSGAPFYLWQAATLGDPSSCKPYTDLDTLKNDIIAAVQNTPPAFDYMTLTLGQLQYYLIHKSYPAKMADAQAEADGQYWWLGGGSKVTDWNSLIAAAKTAQGGIHAHLNTIAHTAVGGAPYYLRKNSTGDPFASQAEMITALKAAVDKGANTWEEVQQRICSDGSTADTYWWGYGGMNLAASVPGKEVADLIAAAQLANQNHSASLNTLTLNMVTGAPYYFRETFAGGQFADLIAAKAKIQAAVTAGATDWNQLQYHFIHAAVGDFLDFVKAPGEASAFYWWKYAPKREINEYDYKTLVAAAFWAEKNGDTAPLQTLTSGYLLNMWFAKGTPANAADFSELDKYASAQDLLDIQSKIKAMVADYILTYGGDPYTLPDFTWYQVQHYLITGTYKPAENPDITSKTYWWNNGGINTNLPTPQDELLAGMLAWAKGVTTDTNYGYIDSITSAMLKSPFSFFKDTNKTSFKPPEVTKIVKPRLKALAILAYNNNVPGDYYNGALLTLNWYQVQYYLINDTMSGYPTDGKNPDYTWAPDWARAKYGQPGGPAIVAYHPKFTIYAIINMTEYFSQYAPGVAA